MTKRTRRADEPDRDDGAAACGWTTLPELHDFVREGRRQRVRAAESVGAEDRGQGLRRHVDEGPAGFAIVAAGILLVGCAASVWLSSARVDGFEVAPEAIAEVPRADPAPPEPCRDAVLGPPTQAPNPRPTPHDDPQAIVRRIEERAQVARDRGRAFDDDPFVAGLLDEIAAAAGSDDAARRSHAAALAHAFVGRPWLGPRHEPVVDAIAERARRDLTEPAMRLLEQLQRNLVRTGARSAHVVAQRALLDLDGSDPVRRGAAALLLLDVEDGRHRDALLRRLVEEADGRLVGLVSERLERTGSTRRAATLRRALARRERAVGKETLRR
jgi:hypothetical protein